MDGRAESERSIRWARDTFASIPGSCGHGYLNYLETTPHAVGGLLPNLHAEGIKTQYTP